MAVIIRKSIITPQGTAGRQTARVTAVADLGDLTKEFRGKRETKRWVRWTFTLAETDPVTGAHLIKDKECTAGFHENSFLLAAVRAFRKDPSYQGVDGEDLEMYKGSLCYLTLTERTSRDGRVFVNITGIAPYAPRPAAAPPPPEPVAPPPPSVQTEPEEVIPY